MKKITSFGLLVLVATMIMGGITESVVAQDDPEILFKIAKNAQEQIRNHISDSSSDKIKSLFQEGSNQVDALNKSLRNEDTESAKKYFLSSMKIFKKISQMLTQDETSKDKITTSKTTSDPTSDLLKLYRYASSLKTITEKYQSSIDFTELMNLFEKAREQISTKQFEDAQETIHKIKQIVDNIQEQLHVQALQQEPERIKKYAQKYLEQLDRLIETTKNQEVSNDIIKKLENARENLSSASNTEDIVNEIRKIISLKKEFELTKNDRLESKIIQIEKILSRLSQMNQVEPEVIKDAKKDLQKIKLILSNGKFEQANIQIGNLLNQLKEIT